MSSTPVTLDSAGTAGLMPDASATPSARVHDEAPRVVIEPRWGWQALNVREMWQYRELLLFLVDVKVQYKQTVLGPAWAVIKPLINMVIFSIVFGQLAGIPSQGEPYPLFVYAGLLPWGLFAASITAASASLVSHAHLLTKVYFPRAFLPAASAGVPLINFFIGLMIYAGLMIGYRTMPGTSIILLPVLVLLTVVASLGLGYLLAGLTVIYRDLRFVVPSMVQAWMFLSPVIYPVTIIPDRFRWLMMLNPMSGVINGYRSVLLNQPIDWVGLGVAAGVSIVLFVPGILVFRRAERRFADLA